MHDLCTNAFDLLAEFGRSDVNGRVPHVAYSWLATTGARIGIGMFVGLLGTSHKRAHTGPPSRARVSLSLQVTFAVLWTLKELAFDLRNDGFQPLTLADSIADLFFAALGFWYARQAINRARGSATDTGKSNA